MLAAEFGVQRVAQFNAVNAADGRDIEIGIITDEHGVKAASGQQQNQKIFFHLHIARVGNRFPVELP